MLITSQELGNILKINSALVRNRGVYVCTVQNEGGTSQASAIVEVERKCGNSVFPALPYN